MTRITPEVQILTIEEDLPAGTERVDSPPWENPIAKDLEPYRRLVELQKQMIELAQQHEQSKRQRDAVHEQMVREAAGRRRERRGLRHRLQRSATRLLRWVPGFLGG